MICKKEKKTLKTRISLGIVERKKIIRTSQRKGKKKPRSYGEIKGFALTKRECEKAEKNGPRGR